MLKLMGKKIFTSYESKMKYDVKTERVRGERSYEEERYTTVETSARYVYNAKI